MPNKQSSRHLRFYYFWWNSLRKRKSFFFSSTRKITVPSRGHPGKFGKVPSMFFECRKMSDRNKNATIGKFARANWAENSICLLGLSGKAEISTCNKRYFFPVSGSSYYIDSVCVIWHETCVIYVVFRKCFRI